MDKNQNNQNQNDVHIEQINPTQELTDLEKTAILQFKIDKEIEKQKEEKIEEELSKTTQFKMLNSRSLNSTTQIQPPKRSV